MNAASRYEARLVLCLLAASLAGCPLEDPGPPYRALVYDYDLATGDYALAEADLPTLRALRGLEGEVTEVLGGVDLAVNTAADPATEEGLVDAIRVRGGRPVDPRYRIEDGVVLPEDFGSLFLFSYYRHMERCRDFFHDSGLPEELPGHIRTFQQPTLGTLLVGGIPLITDNAGYSPTFEAFALFPRQHLLDQLPLAMNLGVVGHEYSHAVFHALVAPGARVPFGLLEGWPPRAENLVRSVDEGFADVFGALVTGDPDFMAPSVPGFVSDARDLSVVREFDGFMDALLDRGVFYDPYPLGSVFASVLWRVGETVGAEDLARGVLDAIVRLGEVAGPRFDVPDMTAILLETVAPGGETALCDALDESGLPLPAGCP
jgi:hypothetical protein